MVMDKDDPKLYVVPAMSPPTPVANPVRKPLPVPQTQYDRDQHVSETMLDQFGLLYRGLLDRYPPAHGDVDMKEARLLASNMMASWPSREVKL